MRTTPAHERALRTRSAIVGTGEILVCLTVAAVLVVDGGVNGFSVLIGGLVTFTGLLTGITTVLARTHVADGMLNIAGATVLRRLVSAFSSITAVLAALSTIPLAAGVNPPGTGIVATLSGAVAATSITCALVVGPLLSLRRRR